MILIRVRVQDVRLTTCLRDLRTCLGLRGEQKGTEVRDETRLIRICESQ